MCRVENVERKLQRRRGYKSAFAIIEVNWDQRGKCADVAGKQGVCNQRLHGGLISEQMHRKNQDRTGYAVVYTQHDCRNGG